MRIRTRGQFELVRRKDDATLLAVARTAGTATSTAGRRDDLARLHALWGLGQMARGDARQAAALVPFLTDSDAEVRAQAAKLLGDARYQAAATSLVAALRDQAPRVRFFAAEALARIGDSAGATAALVTMLAENDDQDVYLRHAGALALSRMSAASLAGLEQHQSRAVRLAAVVALRRMRSATVAQYLGDADELVVAEAARAINDDGGIAGALPALARVLDQARFTSEPLLRRAISANSRVGTAECANRIEMFAARPGGVEALRVEAVAALGAWNVPSSLDRVDGAYLGTASPQRVPQAAESAIARFVDTVADEPSETMRIAIIDAAGRAKLTRASARLVERLRADSVPQVRIAALRALQSIAAPDLPAAVKLALADADASVRAAAITAMPAMPIPEAAKVESIAVILKSGSVPEQQSALALLGKLTGREAREDRSARSWNGCRRAPCRPNCSSTRSKRRSPRAASTPS